MNGYIEEEVNREDCYIRTSRNKEIDLFDWNFELSILRSDQKTIEKMAARSSSIDNLWIAFFNDEKLSDLENRFNLLSKQWQEETGMFSINKQKINDTFLEIISMGKEIIPFILKELKSPYSTASWHIALKALAHFNPVSEHDLRDSDIVKQKWIEWGKANSLI